VNAAGDDPMTCTVQLDASPLYQEVLGSAWEYVSSAVRRGHQFESVGELEITHGSNHLARLLARCAKLPAVGKGVSTRLRIIRRGNREEWNRTIGTRSMRTRQYAADGRILRERFGPLEISFKLEVRAGGIHYHQTRSAIRVGGVSLPLPRAFSPRVAARELPGPKPDSTQVCVTVHLPLVGLLIRYEGEMETPEVLP
jgi:hypothetical protein